eukprot:TRINITY_DN1423_c0_g2_i3.p1 TRINITY_DN1423_c0_g2~~TRINITY_DN1423_c0_g2_i3.p1  ORF type:complete len:367 (-),score=91.96 TRINITY_DN1423_c0_g2_i3:168-1268(-)
MCIRDRYMGMYTYPIDMKTKEGAPFWSLPKRPPTELLFQSSDELDCYFISAAACLRAKVFGIEIPQNARNKEIRELLGKQAEKVSVPNFKPSDEKAKQISSQVNKENENAQEIDVEGEGSVGNQPELEQMKKEFQKLLEEYMATLKEGQQVCYPEEFEKDNDENQHIDYIYAMANLRAKTYKLEHMEWINVKLKAGRIIPALATTTSCVAGLQTIELCKVIAGTEIEHLKNAFLSLAVPIMRLSEPGPPPVTKLLDNLKVTIWDRWVVKTQDSAATNITQVFETLLKTYGLKPRDVFYRSEPVYMENLMSIHGREAEKEETLKKPISDLLDLEEGEEYVDLTITFENPNKKDEILTNTPLVRVHIK